MRAWSPRRSTAAARPPMSTYDRAHKVSPSRRSQTAAIAADTSGRAASYPATSAATIDTNSGSTVQPVRRAGSTTIRRNSSSLGGPTSTWASSISSASGAMTRDTELIARATRTMRDVEGRIEHEVEQPGCDGVDLTGREHLLELVDDEQLRTASSRPGTASIAASGSGPGTMTCGPPWAFPGQPTASDERQQSGPHHGGLAAAGGADDGEQSAIEHPAVSSATRCSRPTNRSASAGS